MTDAWQRFTQEAREEMREAGFSDFAALAGELEDFLDAHSDTLAQREADALQLAADLLYSLQRFAPEPTG